MERKKYLVVMAAGHGARMGSALPKQFIELAGRPILQRTIECFIRAVPDIKVVTVLPKEYMQGWKDLCTRNNFYYPQILVEGGITRFHSVRNALKKVPDGAVVAIQDGVRPLLTPELAASSYSWKTLMQKGVSVSNGSDCPVELPDVMEGIQCAVTRCSLDGTGPYLPGEAFTVQEALDSFTIRSAEGSFEESSKGRIADGYLADFVILGADPFETEPTAIHRIPVLASYLGGRCVYSAEA